jgi:hypothetical protein
MHPEIRSVQLVGTGDAGLTTLLARSTIDSGVTKCLSDLNGFAFASVTTPSDPHLLPGALKYGGVGGLTITAAEGDTAIYGAAAANESELALWKQLAPDSLHSESLTADKVAELLLK